MIVIVFVLLFYSNTNTVFAQEIQEDTTEIELNEVIIHGNQLLNFSNSNLKQMNVERDNFLHISGQTFLENLSNIPGIQLIITGSNITKPVIRGMTLSRVWSGENFVKQEGQQWGLDHGLELDPFTEGNIQIIKGPANVLFGPDAIGGVIHIEKPKFSQIDTQSLSVMLMHRSVNDLWGIHSKYKWSNEHRFFKLQASFQDYANYKVPTDSFVYNSYKLPIDKRRLVNTAGKDVNLSSQFGIQIGSWNVFSNLTYYHQKAGLFKGAFGRPQSMNLNHGESMRTIEDPLQITQHTKALVHILKDFDNSTFENVSSFQLNNRQELSNHRHVLQTDHEALSMNLNTWQNTMRYKWKWNERLTQIGYDVLYQKNYIGGYEFLIPEYLKFQNALYIHHSIFSIPKHKIVLGARIDFSTVKTEDAYRYIYQSGMIDTIPAHTRFSRNFINKNFQAHWDYRINRSSIFQTNISYVERNPNIAELASNGIHHGTFRHEMGDETLESEKGFLLDVGYVYSQNDLDIHVTPFIYYFSNYIYLAPTAYFSTLPEGGQIFQYRQTSAFMTGAEIQLAWTYFRQLKGELNLEYVFSENLQSRYGLPLTPPFTAIKTLEYTFDKKRNILDEMNVRYNIQYVHRQSRIDKYEKETPSYFLHNFSLEKKFQFKSHHFKMDLEVKNIFNTAYLNHLSRYRILNLSEQGRNIAVSIKYLI